MKRKLFAIILIIAILFTNYGFVFAYTRGDASAHNIIDIARTISSGSGTVAYISSSHKKAHSQLVGGYGNPNTIRIYDYNTTNQKQLADPDNPTNQVEFSGSNKSKYFIGDITRASYNIGDVINAIGSQDQTANNYQGYNIRMKFPINQTCTDVATIVYKNYIVAEDNKTYDLKVDINKIRSTKGPNDTNATHVYLTMPYGIREKPAQYANNPSEDPTAYDITTYTIPTNFNIVMSTGTGLRDGMPEGNGGHTEADLTFTIMDGNTPTKLSSMFVFTDIDKGQGIAIKNYKASTQNVFMPVEAYNRSNPNDTSVETHEVKYQYEDNNSTTYIYSSDLAAADRESDVYILGDNVSSCDVTGTWDSLEAGFLFEMNDDYIGHKYRVDFETKCDTQIPDQTVNAGDKATKPPADTLNKEGYEFVEWRKKGTTTAFDFNTPIYEDTTLEAVWRTNVTPYSIDYEVYGGTNAQKNIDKQSYFAGDEFTFGIPTKDGYVFEGWYLDPDKFNDDSYKIDGITPSTTGNLKLYAKWTEEPAYRIDYDLNGGTNTQRNINKQTYTKGETFTFDSPSRSGYDFGGWFLDESYFGDESKKFTKITSTTEGDLTLHAKWIKQSTPDPEPEPEPEPDPDPDPTPVEKTANYTIEYYLEGKDGNYNLEATETKKDIVGKTVTATARTFSHYHENTTHPDTKKTDVLKESGTVLKIFYDRDEYKVTFIPQNGENNITKIVKYSETVDEPTNPTRNEYEFRYWYYKDSNGNEKRYNFDDAVENDIDLYAKWEKIDKEPEPTPSDDGKKDDGKKDDTTATTPIPKTGEFNLGVAILISIIVICGATFALGLFKSRKIK